MTRGIVNDQLSATTHATSADSADASAYTIDHEHARNLVTDVAGQLTRPIAHDTGAPACAQRDLAELATLVEVRSIVDELAARAAKAAAEHGIAYPAIAAAARTTRQNARLRWPGLTAIARKAKPIQDTIDHRDDAR